MRTPLPSWYSFFDGAHDLPLWIGLEISEDGPYSVYRGVDGGRAAHGEDAFSGSDGDGDGLRVGHGQPLIPHFFPCHAAQYLFSTTRQFSLETLLYNEV